MRGPALIPPQSGVPTGAPSDDVLAAAAARAGVAADGAELIRDGSNVLYRLPGEVVARVGPAGSLAVAEKEAAVSRWLNDSGLPAVRLIGGVEQPTVIDGRPVTWWALIPKHRPATPAELGAVLRTLHSLPIPDHIALPEALPEVDPLAGVADRIDAATSLTRDDHDWLSEHLAAVADRLTRLPAGRRRCVVHGDAWQGNVAVPDDGPAILLDLESTALGHPEWDLISLAVDHVDFARITDEDYAAFRSAYGGPDVVTWPGFRVLADAQELRWTAFALSKADTSETARQQSRHRVACLRGQVDRPWSWSAI